ncbi:MerR family transcriptional regulator [Niveispirillum sp. KHB5.9]|uniref:MerR family transcriptional regulator n=1 Tax=Niveispirillum sp. KHB5.9 TaxID=3400269 RepID=UPI003A8C739D
MDVQVKQFRHAVMLKVAEVSNNTLQNWLKRGLLPFGDMGSRYARRLYSAQDIVAVRTMVTCIEKVHMEARYAAVVAQNAAEHSTQFYGMRPGTKFLDRTLYCQFEGDEISTWLNVGTAGVLDPVIAIPIGRIIVQVLSDLDTMLNGPHEIEAYANTDLTQAEIEQYRNRDLARQKYLLDDSATEPPTEVPEDH